MRMAGINGIAPGSTRVKGESEDQSINISKTLIESSLSEGVSFDEGQKIEGSRSD